MSAAIATQTSGGGGLGVVALLRAFDKLDLDNPSLAPFWPLITSKWHVELNMVKNIDVAGFKHFIDHHWAATLIAQKDMEAKCSKPLMAQTREKKRIEAEIEQVGVEDLMAWIFRMFGPHKQLLRDRKEEELICTAHGNSLDEGEPGRIDWYHPDFFAKDLALDPENRPCNVEEWWSDMKKQFPDFTNIYFKEYNKLLVGASLRCQLSDHGWEVLLSSVRTFLVAMDEDPTIDMKPFVLGIYARAQKQMPVNEAHTLVEALQDTFIAMSMELEDWFCNFMNNLISTIKSAVESKLAEKDMSIASLIQMVTEQCEAFRGIFRQHLLFDLDPDALPENLLANPVIAFLQKHREGADGSKQLVLTASTGTKSTANESSSQQPVAAAAAAAAVPDPKVRCTSCKATMRLSEQQMHVCGGSQQASAAVPKKKVPKVRCTTCKAVFPESQQAEHVCN